MYPILSQIEGLFEDINFSTKVTRDTLEEICADLFRRVKNPVQDLLRSTEITMVRPHLLYMSTIGTSGSATHMYCNVPTLESGGISKHLTLTSVEEEVATYHSSIVTHTVPHSIRHGHTHSMTVNAVLSQPWSVWNI